MLPSVWLLWLPRRLVGARNKKLGLGPPVSHMLSNHWGSGWKVSRKELRGHKQVDKMKADRCVSHSPSTLQRSQNHWAAHPARLPSNSQERPRPA